jgi:hypothetical protein
MTPSKEASTYELIVEWLGTVADASAEGAITNECELPSGRWVVCEEWPSRAAYLEYARNRHATEAMIYQDRKARAEDAHHRHRRCEK